MTHDELGRHLHEARAGLDDICDCGSIHGYVEAAGAAWKGGVLNTEDYADALARAWSAVRKHYLADRLKPTIDELEKILNSDEPRAVVLQPDGSITTRRT